MYFFLKTPFYKPVKQTENNIKLGKVLILVAVQKFSHAWKKKALDALVYIHQNKSYVNKKGKKNNRKIMSTAANVFVTENVVLKVAA